VSSVPILHREQLQKNSPNLVLWKKLTTIAICKHTLNTQFRRPQYDAHFKHTISLATIWCTQDLIFIITFSTYCVFFSSFSTSPFWVLGEHKWSVDSRVLEKVYPWPSFAGKFGSNWYWTRTHVWEYYSALYGNIVKKTISALYGNIVKKTISALYHVWQFEANLGFWAILSHRYTRVDDFYWHKYFRALSSEGFLFWFLVILLYRFSIEVLSNLFVY